MNESIPPTIIPLTIIVPLTRRTLKLSNPLYTLMVVYLFSLLIQSI